MRARRKIHDAQESPVVLGRGDQAQIRERMLDLGALEKAHAAVDAIGKARAEQRMFEDPRLRVRSIEQGDLVQRHAVGRKSLHHIDDERRLVVIAGRRKRADELALAFARPQILAQPRLVVADERVGRVEDVPVRAVILLELDQLDRLLGRGEVALELLHVGDLRAAESVDRLVVVAHGEHRGVRTRQHPQPLVLQRVRVLELVDQQVREAPLVVSAQRVVAGEQLVAAQQELREVDRAFALAHLVVERVVLDLPAREIVARLDHVRPQALFLGVRR